jgi:hypothetical protein
MRRHGASNQSAAGSISGAGLWSESLTLVNDVSGDFEEEKKVRTLKDASDEFSPAPLLPALRAAQRSVWIGVLSFEERCRSSLEILARHQIRFSDGVVIDYTNTSAVPLREDQERRAKNWKQMQDVEGEVFYNKIERAGIAAYSFDEISQFLERIIEERMADFALFDITCLTKIHTLSLAASLAEGKMSQRWALVYSTPENYQNLPE